MRLEDWRGQAGARGENVHLTEHALSRIAECPQMYDLVGRSSSLKKRHLYYQIPAN
jgi:hypothetical protein